MCMRYLLYLVDFHVELAVILAALGGEYVECLAIGHIQQLPISAEVNPYNVLAVFLYYFGRPHPP